MSAGSPFPPLLVPFQDDFDEFADVDELYQSLPMEKLEALDTETIPPPPPVHVKEKVTLCPFFLPARPSPAA